MISWRERLSSIHRETNKQKENIYKQTEKADRQTNRGKGCTNNQRRQRDKQRETTYKQLEKKDRLTAKQGTCKQPEKMKKTHKQTEMKNRQTNREERSD